jgi:diguanylate cyclase (GGDEF)-like protein
MANSLKEITYETIKNLKRQDIVLPGEYSKTFQTYANAMGIKIEDEELILNDLHQDENRLNFIVQETNENLQSLGESAKTAETAITNKDDKALRAVQNDIIKMQEKIDFLQNELFSDSLTKAKNRKWFCDYYLKNDTFPHKGLLAFIDLNDFKSINDDYGHLIGDQVLRYLAEFLKKEFPFEEIETIRYAGDEFIVLVKNDFYNYEDGLLKMTQSQEKLSQLKLKSKTINNLNFSFSFGLVPFNQGEQLDEILKVADEKMYENKKYMKSKK